MPARTIEAPRTVGAAGTAALVAAGRLWHRHRTVLLYGVIGCSGILLDLALFAALYNLAGWGAQAANVVSLTAGITNNFVLNSWVNFRVRDNLARRYARFLTVGLAGMGLVAAALWLFGTLGGLDPNLIKVSLVPGVAALQYWANSRWSFRTHQHRSSMALLAAVAMLGPLLSAATAPAAQPWTPRLVTGGGDDVHVAVRDGAVALAGGLSELTGPLTGAADRSPQRPATGYLVLPEHRLAAPANQIGVELDSVAPPGSDVAVDARGMRDNGRWTQWVPAHPGEPAALPEASRLVQLRLVLTSAIGAAPPGVEQLRAIPDLIEDLLDRRPREGPSADDAGPPAPTYPVFATREGLVGRTTANGTVIGPDDRFVALPSRRALASKGTNEYTVRVCADNGRCAWAPVWDVGPWNTTDDYWNPPSRRQSFSDLPQGVPEAQAAFRNGYNGGRDEFGRQVRNPAGIDLSNRLFREDLQLDGNDEVRVTFAGAQSGSLAPAVRTQAVRAAPNPAARQVGVAVEGSPLGLRCRAGSGWFKIGSAQFVPESGLAEAPDLPAC